MKLNISVSAKQLTEEQPSRCRPSLITSLYRVWRFPATPHSPLIITLGWSLASVELRTRGSWSMELGAGTQEILKCFYTASPIFGDGRHCWTGLRSSGTPSAGLRIHTDTNCCHWWSLGDMTRIQAGKYLEIMYSTNNIPVTLVLVCREAGNGRALVGRVF